MAVPMRNLDNTTHRPPPPSKRAYILLGILAALILGYKIFNDVTVYKGEKVQEYLEQSQNFIQESNDVYNNLIERVYQAKKSNSNKLLYQVQDSQNILLNNHKSFTELVTPHNFTLYHTLNLKILNSQIETINYLEKGLITKSLDRKILNKYISDISASVSETKLALIDGFEKEGMKYTEDINGVTYWYKSDDSRRSMD